MYKKYEVRPVVVAENGEVTPFLTYSDAASYADETDGELACGLYGMEEAGIMEEITTATKEKMISLIYNLFGFRIQWSGNRMVFDRSDFACSPLPSDVASPAEAGKAPRVLVVVRGGIAETYKDSNVDVQVFDWDNYKEADPENRIGVPKHFADLSKPIGVPVEEDEA